MATNREVVYQIHVLLYEVKRDVGDESGNTAAYDILQEEEPAGYKEEFKTYEEAVQVYEVLTGVQIEQKYRMVPIAYDMKYLSDTIREMSAVFGPEAFQNWLTDHDYKDAGFWERPFGALMQDYIDEKSGLKEPK